MIKVFQCLLLILFSTSTFAVTTLKISTEYPDNTSVLKELRAAAERIEERTEGRVDIKLYPGGVMGDSAAVLRKIRIGQLHGAFIQSGAVAGDYTDIQVLNAPLLFRNFDEVDVVRNELDEEFRRGLLSSGWHTYGIIEGGFAYAMTQTPASSLDDLRETKIWLPSNDRYSEKVAKAFDIDPIIMNLGDVLTALQTGAVNAIVAPPTGVIALQWHNQLSYLTDAPFMYIFGVIAIQERALAQVTDEDKLIITEEFDRASMSLDEIARVDNLKAFDALTQIGLSIDELGDQARAEVEREATLATEFLIADGEFSQAAYDRVQSLLEQVR